MINSFNRQIRQISGGSSLRIGSRAALAALGLVACMTTTGTQAQARDTWENLGCVEVGRRPDRDIIEVGRREGRYRALRLSVTGNDVNIADMKVVYGNGSPDDIALRSEFREGTTSRNIDLKGDARAINRIEIISKRGYKGRGRGRGRICVAGLKVERGRPVRPVAKWEQLGCQKVGFLRDKDSISVGRREGRFKAIRLNVARNDVHINNLTVVYGNGSPDRIAVNANVRQGSVVGPFDLKGRERVISRIDMDYRSRLGFGGTALVCVDGLQNIR